MCNVLLVTCNSDSATNNLRSTALDAIGVIGRAEGGFTLRERHLYARAIPELSETVVTALRTNPDRRSAEQWKAAACSDLLVQEVHAADVLVIAAPFENGRPPKELSDWGIHIGLAARCFSGRHQSVSRMASKLAIVIAEAHVSEPETEASLTMLCGDLRDYLRPLGVSEVALFEADRAGYPLRSAQLMLVVSRSRAVH
jgi:FMN-dependent NADH-azoreductase